MDNKVKYGDKNIRGRDYVYRFTNSANRQRSEAQNTPSNFRGVLVHQRKYIEDVLRRFHMENCNSNGSKFEMD